MKFSSWILTGVAVIAIGAGAYFYFAASGGVLRIDAQKPERVRIGVPFALKISVANDSSKVFRDAELSLELPDGTAFVGEGAQRTVLTKKLGSVGDGSVIEEEFNVMLLGGAENIKRFTATVSYLPNGIDSRFEQKQDFDVVADEPGLSLDVVAPESALAGEEFQLDISYKNISDIDLKGLQLKMDYPPGFEFKKASLAPDIGNSVWNLGDLRKGSEMKFYVRGNLAGAAESSHEFIARLEAEFLGESYEVNKKSASVAIAASPLTLAISVNDNPDAAVGAGENLQYVVAYSNVSDEGLRNALLKVQLAGEMYDFSTLSAQNGGVVAPAGNSITWSPATFPDFAVIGAHASGQITFSIRTKAAYPIRRLGDRNFLLKADARLESETVPKGVQAKKIVGLARMETKVKGGAGVDAKVFFRDADSGILNSGPIPPKVGVETQYIAHWLVKNYSTDISGVTIKTKLGDNVRWTGTSKADIGVIAYDTSTNEVTWTLERVPATKGILDAPIGALFQIAATPGPTAAHTYMTLFGDTMLSAKDEFTGGEIKATDAGVTTALPDDPTIGGQGGIVVQ